MRLLLAAALCAVLLGGCPKSPDGLSTPSSSGIAGAEWQAVQYAELRKQTVEMQQQTALLREIRDNTRRTP